MSEEQGNCAQCDAPLKTLDSVCTFCEKQLLDSINQQSQRGNYICPACNLKFSKPELLMWPVNARWYQAQWQRQVCPHCKRFLCSKYFKAQRITGAFCLLLMVLNGIFGLPNTFFFIGYLVLIEVAIALDEIRCNRKKMVPICK
jgi:hypothetical protein